MNERVVGDEVTEVIDMSWRTSVGFQEKAHFGCWIENRLNVGQSRSRDASEEANSIIQLRDVDGLGQGGDSGASEEWPDLG